MDTGTYNWRLGKQPNKAWETRNMETYAAMIDRMDQGIGRIVDQLKADGRLDNTLILFLQDNGACAEPSWRKPIKQEAPTTFPRWDLTPCRRAPLRQCRRATAIG